jgi:arabinofuranosyltransferase
VADRAPANGEPAAGAGVPGRTTGLLFVLVLVVYLAHALYYRGLIDDAFISFRYAQSLAEGQGLVFNPGERVEGYSNLLWVLILAVGMRLGGDPAVWSQALGIAAGLGTLVIVFRAAARETPVPLALAAPAFLATNRTFCAWSTGGLETSLFTFLSVLGVSRLGAARPRALLWAGIALGLAALTRPEGVLVAAVVGLALVLEAWRELRPTPQPSPQPSPPPSPQPSMEAAGGPPWRDLLAVLGPVTLLVGGQLLFRLLYYGRWAPNTAAVKIPGLYPASGLVHMALFSRDNLFGPEAVALALAIAAAWPGRDPSARTFSVTRYGLLVAAVYLLYIALIGGDHFEYRFFHPVLGLLAVPVAAGIARGAQAFRWTGSHSLPLTAAGTLTALVALHGIVVSYAGFQPVDRPVALGPQRGRVSVVSVEFEQEFVRPFVRLGQWLGAYADPGETVALRAIGAVAYYSRLRVLDVHGLIEPDLSRLPVRRRDAVGHERRADVAYLLERGMTYYAGGHPPIILPGPDPNRFVRVRLSDGQILVFQSVDPKARIQPGEYAGE